LCDVPPPLDAPEFVASPAVELSNAVLAWLDGSLLDSTPFVVAVLMLVVPDVADVLVGNEVVLPELVEPWFVAAPVTVVFDERELEPAPLLPWSNVSSSIPVLGAS
jgi:hypothetical protein